MCVIIPSVTADTQKKDAPPIHDYKNSHNNIILQLFKAFFRERQTPISLIYQIPKTMSYSSVEKSISGASVTLPARSNQVPDVK